MLKADTIEELEAKLEEHLAQRRLERDIEGVVSEHVGKQTAA
jgi:hypothetical protein